MTKDRLIKDVFRLMLKNRRISGEHQYTVPSPYTYPFQWLWDSCFNAIILSHLNIEDAKKELLSLVFHQFENGMIPHIIYWDREQPTDFPVIEWGREHTSTITQPPMLAYVAFNIYQKDQDKSFIKQIYTSLKNYYNFLLIDRDPRKIHLPGIINPDESGEDNSSRFDFALGLGPKHTLEENLQKRLDLVSKDLSCNFETVTCMSNFFWIADVPFNAILIENLEMLSKLAREIGKFSDADYFLHQREEIVVSMGKWMFEDGIFWSVFGQDPQKIKIKTWHIFAPLFAGLYTKTQARDLVSKYLKGKDFKTKFIVPSVATDESSYDPEGFWRGPIWMAVNWFVYKGLKKYKFDEMAKQVYKSSLNLIEKSGFREYYHPQTGQGLGARDFTWGGLVLDMYE